MQRCTETNAKKEDSWIQMQFISGYECEWKSLDP